MGVLDVAPGEIAVLPRGIRFSVTLPDTTARGYICENAGTAFTLPQSGRAGGLAYARHFLTPIASYEDKTGEFELIAKADGTLWQARIDHSPLDVVAWQGNYAPYKYNLDNFMALGAAAFDQPDPFVFTVLTSPGNVDFMAYTPRWQVAENTFRRPCFSRSASSVWTGLIHGKYEGKSDGGLVPGGVALHNRMVADGPDTGAWEVATTEKAVPEQLSDTLSFSFVTPALLRPTVQAMNQGLQQEYAAIWQNLPKNFKSV
jgi:homogentisate 1,2-dioxygenase